MKFHYNASDKLLLYIQHCILFRVSSKHQLFCQKCVIKIFSKFIGKPLCQSLFLKKEALAEVFSCEFDTVFKNRFFYRTSLVVGFNCSPEGFLSFLKSVNKIFKTDCAIYAVEKTITDIEIQYLCNNILRSCISSLCNSFLKTFNKVSMQLKQKGFRLEIFNVPLLVSSDTNEDS